MKTNKFKLSRYHITALDSGSLYPVGVREVIPGDTFQHSMQALVRLQPMVAPTMHPHHIEINHFFVPSRLIWDDSENFFTGGPDGTSAPILPYAQIASDAPNSLTNVFNYMGVRFPETTPGGVSQINILPVRAYNLIYNQYYRDQDLVNPVSMVTTSGLDNTTSQTVQRIAWNKDRFTAARPWAQKGPTVSIPVQDPGGHNIFRTPNAPAWTAKLAGADSTFNSQDLYTDSTGNLTSTVTGTDASLDPNGGLGLLLSTLGINPNDIRVGLAAQKFEEMTARYGSRYTEYLRAQFGVRAQDSRLQRPEYLGGGSQTIQMSEVLQTSNPGTAEIGDATGAMKGHGIGSVRSNAYRRTFPEHGYVISLMHIRPVSIYNDSLERFWLKSTKFDFYTPQFAHVGSAAIYKGEVKLTNDTNDRVGWGFQDQYYDYRSAISYVSGSMRTTFDYWHDARKYSSLPTLNGTFITCDPSDRIFAAPVDQNYMVMIYDKCIARRPIARTGSTSNL